MCCPPVLCGIDVLPYRVLSAVRVLCTLWQLLMSPCCPIRPASSSSTLYSGGLAGEASFGALAVSADTVEDKLKLVETKRQ